MPFRSTQVGSRGPTQSLLFNPQNVEDCAALRVVDPTGPHEYHDGNSLDVSMHSSSRDCPGRMPRTRQIVSANSLMAYESDHAYVQPLELLFPTVKIDCPS